MDDLIKKTAEDLFNNGGKSMYVTKLDDNGNILLEHITVEEWDNTHKEEVSVSERIELANKLKELGSSSLDKRIYKKKK